MITLRELLNCVYAVNWKLIDDLLLSGPDERQRDLHDGRGRGGAPHGGPEVSEVGQQDEGKILDLFDTDRHSAFPAKSRYLC